ncbi:MAG: hypothetical protein M3041_20330 [Acidobacteriota bacterium]|nr:hypothetical protein [Acidobacteriota bacterium]
MRRRDWVDLAIVLGVWGAAIAFIRPRGEFPILDDWDFAIATWNFARTGHFHFTPFTAVSLRAMVLWGAAWTRLFGESFEVLRASTLTLAAITIAVIHEIFRRAELPRFARIVATLAFAFQPIFLWSSCTYMTEVPFVCISAIAFLLIWRGLANATALLVALGSSAAILSCFIRQTGVINFAAPLIVAVVMRKNIRLTAILVAAGAVIAATFLIAPQWLSGSPTEFASHYKVWHESSFRLPEMFALADHYVVFNIQNAALFFLPLVVPLIFVARKHSNIEWMVAAGVVILWRVQRLVNMGIAMPYFAFASQEDILQGNIFMDFGLGPPTVLDVWALVRPYPFHLTHIGKLIVTYLSVCAGAVMVGSLFKRRDLLFSLAVALAGVGTAALVASGLYTDRYSLDSAWSIGIALALIVPWEKKSARIAAGVVLLVVATFSIFSIQEYFAWNRQRWAAYDSLRARGVAVTDIDGGSEPTNLYEVSRMNRDDARRRTLYRPARRYVIAFGPLPGHVVVARYPFTGWLGLHRGALYLLRWR